MNNEIKTEWCSALRSGEYVQGTERLRSEDKTYCCIGVLADVLVQHGIGKWTEYNEYLYKSTSYYWLPGDLRSILDISSDMQDKLVDMNDVNASNFNQIADYIEATL